MPMIKSTEMATTQVKFERATEDCFKEVLQYIITDYFPDDTPLQAAGVELCPQLERLFVALCESVGKPHDITYVARDGGKLVAIRTAEIGTKEELKQHMQQLIGSDYQHEKINTVFAFVRSLFDQMDWDRALPIDNNEKVLCFNLVCVSRSHRRQGIAAKIINIITSEAKQKGCTYVFVIAASITSQAMFRKLNFDVVAEKRYDSWLDQDGKRLLLPKNDTKLMQLYVKKL